VEENYVLWKDDNVYKSQGEENPTNTSNQNEEFSKVEFSKVEKWKLHMMDSIDLFLTPEVFKL
jgi:hypothetical protein